MNLSPDFDLHLMNRWDDFQHIFQSPKVVATIFGIYRTWVTQLSKRSNGTSQGALQSAEGTSGGSSNFTRYHDRRHPWLSSIFSHQDFFKIIFFSFG